jgi:hypothetical protein
MKALDRVEWVSIIMEAKAVVLQEEGGGGSNECQCSIESRNFLTSYATMNSSRKFLCHGGETCFKLTSRRAVGGNKRSQVLQLTQLSVA